MLQTVLLDEPLDFLLELVLLSHLFLLHLGASEGDVSLVFLGGGWLLDVDVSIQTSGVDTMRAFQSLHRWVDILIGLVHVDSQVSCRLWLVELEGLGHCSLLRLLERLHLGDELLLNLAEVGHGAGSRGLEAKHRLGVVGLFGRIEVFSDASAFLILVPLHAGRQFG